jgi:hypothetical protein
VTNTLAYHGTQLTAIKSLGAEPRTKRKNGKLERFRREFLKKTVQPSGNLLTIQEGNPFSGSAEQK